MEIVSTPNTLTRTYVYLEAQARLSGKLLE